ncbi:hypothetical protein KY315_00425 [Candidatus Woesearchaeota archaeon]|nr:hypothetical protein [Candidatus Woesearchaeota archaeon]
MYYFGIDMPLATIFALNILLSVVILALLIWQIKKGGKMIFLGMNLPLAEILTLLQIAIIMVIWRYICRRN